MEEGERRASAARIASPAQWRRRLAARGAVLIASSLRGPLHTITLPELTALVHSAEGSAGDTRSRCIDQESPLCSDDDAAVAAREPGLDGVGAAAHPVSFPRGKAARTDRATGFEPATYGYDDRFPRAIPPAKRAPEPAVHARCSAVAATVARPTTIVCRLGWDGTCDAFSA
jgi:hypothetical protein